MSTLAFAPSTTVAAPAGAPMAGSSVKDMVLGKMGRGGGNAKPPGAPKAPLPGKTQPTKGIDVKVPGAPKSAQAAKDSLQLPVPSKGMLPPKAPTAPRGKLSPPPSPKDPIPQQPPVWSTQPVYEQKVPGRDYPYTPSVPGTKNGKVVIDVPPNTIPPKAKDRIPPRPQTKDLVPPGIAPPPKASKPPTPSLPPQAKPPVVPGKVPTTVQPRPPGELMEDRYYPTNLNPPSGGNVVESRAVKARRLLAELRAGTVDAEVLAGVVREVNTPHELEQILANPDEASLAVLAELQKRRLLTDETRLRILGFFTDLRSRNAGPSNELDYLINLFQPASTPEPAAPPSPMQTPPTEAVPPPQAAGSGGGLALAAAGAGAGFLVGGPVGAAIGAAAGFLAGRKK